jgi:hypothetical protein
MGGIGSGNRYRYGGKATCESFTRIELPFLRKRGMLQPGYYGMLAWSIGGEPSGDIRFRMHENGMELIYKYRARGAGEWQHVNEDNSLLLLATAFRWPASLVRLSLMPGELLHPLWRQALPVPQVLEPSLSIAA